MFLDSSENVTFDEVESLRLLVLSHFKCISKVFNLKISSLKQDSVKNLIFTIADPLNRIEQLKF